MKYGEVPGVAKPISRIVQGCIMLKDGDGLEKSFEILDMAVEAGINAFDHSHCYGGGTCNRVFGKWLAARGNSDDLVILAKGCHPGHANGQRIDRVNPDDMSREIMEDLEMFGVESVDLWMFHRDNPAQPVGPLIDRLNEHIEKGHIKAFGGSNWSYKRIAEANDYAKRNGLVGFTMTSPNFSLAEQLESPWGDDCLTISGPEHAADRQWYTDNNLAVFTWSSLARGFLSGRITRDNVEQVRSQYEEHTFRCYECEANWQRIDRAKELGEAKGMTIAQIALAFVLNQPFNAFSLVGMYNREEFAASTQAVECVLTPQEIDYLDLRRDSL